MIMNKRNTQYGLTLRFRLIALVLSMIMVLGMFPLGTKMPVVAANEEPTFVFTDKNIHGIPGIVVTLRDISDDAIVTSLPSGSDGVAHFKPNELIVGHTYTYSVATGAYKPVTGGQITIKVSDNKVDIKLFAPVPEGSISPSSSALVVGESVVLQANATGMGSLTYQWYKNLSKLDGKTESKLTLENLKTEDSATYTCEVHSSLSAANENKTLSANISVSQEAPAVSPYIKPLFIFTDRNGVGIPGIVVTLVGTNGEGTVKSEPSDSNGVANFRPNKVKFGSAYTCSVATGAYIPVTDSTITITDANTPLQIKLYVPAPTGSISPQNPSVTVGDSVTLQANASGMGQLSYQWFKDGSLIDGATNSKLTIDSVLLSDKVAYSCEVTSNLTNLSDKLTVSSTLSVSPAPLVPVDLEPLFTFINSKPEGIPGIVVTLTGTNGEDTIVSKPSDGNGVAKINLKEAVIGSTYTYSVDTGAYKDVTGGQITIGDANTPLDITLYAPVPTGSVSPQNPSIAEGDSVTLQANASGMGTLSYQWFKNGFKLDGKTNSSLTIDSVQSTDAADYSCEVTSALSAVGDKLTVSTSLTVSATPTVVPVQTPPSFVFSNKWNWAIPGIVVTLKGTNGERDVVSEPSDNNGVATFRSDELVVGSTYTYSVANGEYASYTSDETITIKSYDNKQTPITLYAPAPVGSASPQNLSLIYGDTNSVTLQANASSLFGWSLNYQWYKGVVKIEGATNSSYTINNLKVSDTAGYTCIVTHNLSKDGVYSEIGTNLTVSEATPKITVVPSPASGADYNKNGVTLTATVVHPTNNTVAKPAGNVSFYVDDVLIGTESLNNGVATLVDIDLARAASYAIYAKYDGSSDSNYADATSDTIPTYEVGKITPREGTDYSLNTPNGDNGWYKYGRDFEISPVSGGLFDRITLDPAGGSSSKLSITDETSKNGADVTFYLVNSVSGEVSNPKTIHYKLDKTAPTGIAYDRPSFDNYIWFTWYHRITFTASDNSSGLKEIIWNGKDGSSHNVPKIDGVYVSEMTRDQWNNMASVAVKDDAGNWYVMDVANKSITVTYSSPTIAINPAGDPVTGNNHDSNTRFFYKADQVPVSVKFTAKSKDFLTDTIHITVNGAEIPVDTWIHDSVKEEYTRTISLAADGEYIIAINATGFSVSSEEYPGKVNTGSYVSNKIIIDTTAPVITAAYSPATPATGNAAYSDTRTAVFSVTEKYFESSNLAFSSFSATDIEGNHLPNENELEEALLTALKSATWTPDGDKHVSSAIPFSAEASYSFTLKCTDYAGNGGSYIESTPFTVDKSSPNNVQIAYKTNPVSTFLQVITFGFYKPSVTIELYADDAVSGVGHFNWTFTREDGSSTTLNVPTESAQIDSTDTGHFRYENNGKTAVATLTLTADEFAQYRGSISFTVTDKAGHTSAAHYGDGTAKYENGNQYNTDPDHVIVVDTISPTRTVSYPMPQQIRDKDTLAPYVGDKAARANTEGINSILYYDKTCGDMIPVTLKITEANFYADDTDLIVKVNGTPYTIDNWAQTGDEWTGTIELIDDGAYTISVSYTDKSGNVMTPYQSEKIVIDRVNPTIDKYVFTPLTSDGTADTSAFVEVLEYGYYFKTAFNASIYTSDASPSSGFDIISYRLVPYENGVKKDEITGTLPVSNGVANLGIPAGFKGQIYVESFDNAGNHSGQVTPQSFIIDQDVPAVNILMNNTTSYADANGNKLFITDMSVTATITDTSSGIKEIGYSQSSEKAGFARKSIVLANTGYHVGDSLGDGWVVAAMDANLVTKVTKTFSYTTDDNDILITLDATDRSGNKIARADSEKFTIDKTSPIINVSFREDNDSDVYYEANRIADITVIERNFSASLIKTAIENKFGDVPGITFTKITDSEYKAVIEFDEGDYSFNMSGTDFGNHAAVVNYSGGNENAFYVDKTKPVVSANFAEFTNDATDNSFNKDKTVTILITEHNFDASLVNLRILRKDAGADHNSEGLTDITSDFLKGINWVADGDKHSITLTFSADAVYFVEVSPSDKAGNAAAQTSTGIFEIDKTAPVVRAKDGSPVSSEDIEFLDVYTADRKNDPVPTVDFSDMNVDHINYVLTVWIPDYSDPEALPIIKPVRIYLEEDTGKSGVIKGSKFTLPDFTKDGIYALELTAVDVAGNESALNINTYARIVDQDVLAFIMNSNVKDKTGLFSFQDENGTPISMRPDSFTDLTIFVLAKSDTDVDIVLRDTNAQEIPVDAQETTDDSIYGLTMYNFVLKSDFFKNNFAGDTDVDLYLTVKNDGNRIDLGRMHIDNVAPSCVLPSEFRSWNWYFGETARTITLTNISEQLDQNRCKVYDNGKEIDFIYSSTENTITFTLSKGWHNVGVVLSDMAGNDNSIQEREYLYIGYFWLWIIIGVSVIGIAVAVSLIIRNRRRRRKLENE